jgi:hypothetical protein
MIVMERLDLPRYMLMEDFYSVRTQIITHFFGPCMHSILCSIRTHLHSNNIIHGDLHFGNIFVCEEIKMFTVRSNPVKFIDFGRSIKVSEQSYDEPNIRLIFSVDVIMLVRAACRMCVKTSSSKRTSPQEKRLHHEWTSLVINMVSTFLDHGNLIAFEELKTIATTNIAAKDKHKLSSSSTCSNCSEVFEWVNYLLKHKCFHRKGHNERGSFLDIVCT